MKTNVIRKGVVSEALFRLREQKIHTLFAGYLALQRRSAELRRLTDLQPDFRNFFDEFFLVKDHPLGKPYIKPFTEQTASNQNLWLNDNVAGSYAPSSLRAGQPFRKVVTIEKKAYSLPDDHAAQAARHLLFNTRVSVTDLAIFLYRDFGMLGDSFSIFDLIGIFAYEFGYADEKGVAFSDDFSLLFSLQGASSWDIDWLEQYD